MDIKQMTAFCEVMRTGSVSEAARKLGRTQPAISHLLVKLEDEFGMPLFERRGARLHPVPEAEYLFRQSIDVLRNIEDIQATMHRMRDVTDGELRIVSMPGPTIEFLPMLISQHFSKTSQVNVTMFSRSSEAVLRLMNAQQFDIGIADSVKSQNGKQSTLHRTFRYRRICAVPSDHPLARKDVINIDDLANEPLASLLTEHRTTSELTKCFEEAGYRPYYRFSGQFFYPLFNYVSAGLAIAVVDPISMGSWKRIHPDQSQISFVPFEPRLSFSIDVISPSNRAGSRLAEAFTGHLIEALEALQQEHGC